MSDRNDSWERPTIDPRGDTFATIVILLLISLGVFQFMQLLVWVISVLNGGEA